MNLSKAEIKELNTILTFDSVQRQADKLREVGEHRRADTLWNLQHRINDVHDEEDREIQLEGEGE